MEDPEKTENGRGRRLYQSAANGLGHELGHAYNWFYRREDYRRRFFNKVPDSEGFGNEEEKYTTLVMEKSISKKLKEPRRKEHNGLAVPVSSPVKRGRN